VPGQKSRAISEARFLGGLAGRRLGEAGGGVECVEDGVDVVGDGVCEAMDSRDGEQSHGDCDEGVLDDVLAGVFLAQAGEKP